MIDSFEIVKYSRYRTGWVYGAWLPRELFTSLEDKLHKMNKTDKDNHVCFEIMDTNRHKVAIMFTDMSCVVGTSIEDRRW